MLQVISQQNFGSWLSTTYPNPVELKSAAQLQLILFGYFVWSSSCLKIVWKAMSQLLALHTLNDKPVLTLVPQSSLAEFYLELWKFDYSKDAKSGCGAVQKFIMLSNVDLFFLKFHCIYLNPEQWCSLISLQSIPRMLNLRFIFENSVVATG